MDEQNLKIYKNSFYFKYPVLSFLLSLSPIFFPIPGLIYWIAIRNDKFIISIGEKGRNILSILFIIYYIINLFFIFAFLLIIYYLVNEYNEKAGSIEVLLSVSATALLAVIGNALYKYHNYILCVKEPAEMTIGPGKK